MSNWKENYVEKISLSSVQSIEKIIFDNNKINGKHKFLAKFKEQGLMFIQKVSQIIILDDQD